MNIKKDGAKMKFSRKEEVLKKNDICIPERKKTEKKYRTIVQTSMDGFWITDIKGHFLDVNNSYCKLIGYSRDELLKMRIPDIEAIEKPKDTAQRIKKILKTGHDRFETKQVCKDGKIIDIEVSVNYLKAEGGLLVVFLRDITKRKKTEEKFSILAQRLASFFQSTSDMASIKDDKFRYILINKNLAKFLGRKINEVIGKTDFELLPKTLAESCKKTDKKALKVKRLIISQEKFGKKVYETRKFPVLLEEGKIGVGGFIRDITALKEREEKYSALIDLLAESLR